jgi:hypothetical protein
MKKDPNQKSREVYKSLFISSKTSSASNSNKTKERNYDGFFSTIQFPKIKDS